MLDPRAQLEDELDLLGSDGYTAEPRQLARGLLSLLLPPEDISTVECAAKYRYLPNPEGTGKRLYDRTLTPYMDGPQDALDDPNVRHVIVPGPGRTGKALALDTPIITPAGWRTMATLSVGDEVFDQDGAPTRVTAVSPVMDGRPCYRVRFDDGAELVADADHLWEVIYSPWGGQEGQSRRVLTTQELIPLAHGRANKTSNNLAIDVCGQLQWPEADLPIEPYTFGAWLGDGTALQGAITLHEKDADLLEQIKVDGYEIEIRSKPRPGNLTVAIKTPADQPHLCNRGHDRREHGAYSRDERGVQEWFGGEILVQGGRCKVCARMDAKYFRYGTVRETPLRRDTFRFRLEAMGVLDNKHVPRAYLQASIGQRMALLQGWMDTDGTADARNGRCNLTTVEPQMASDALELLRGLGFKPTMRKKEAYAVLNGVRVRGRDAYEIGFTAYRETPIFRLERKQDRLRSIEGKVKPTAVRRRRIVSIDAVETVPVRCIAVASERRLFLAGRDMIPTHNSIAGENHLFKRLRNGPLTDTIIYLPAKSDVDSYADKEFADFFNLHPEISAKLGKRTTDNKREFKRVQGRAIQLFPANPGTVRQKQAPLIMATEIDGFRPALRAAFRGLAEIRGRAYGNQFKLYMESHPDAGYTSGIASAWLETNRGLWFWPCPGCGDYSSPHPLAPKGMHMRMDYVRLDDVDDDDMLDHVEKTAGLLCPHCGEVIRDEHKSAMNALGKWVFDGQTISPDGSVIGESRKTEGVGFWIHGTMSPFVSIGRLAKEYVAALVFFERTRKPERLKEVTAKSLGEVYEGAGAGSRVLDPKRLMARAQDEEANPGFGIGTVPEGVQFLTAAVDVGGKKFDVLITGWDLEGRSWLIDRFTIFQGLAGREVRPPERQADWLVIRERLLRHRVPLQADLRYGMPIAAIAVDTGGSGNLDGEEPGGVTWKAREFARQMLRTGESGQRGYRLMLIKGGGAKKAPEVGAAKEINRDNEGKPMVPPVKEYMLNVDKLKALSVERLIVTDGGPGQVHFAHGLPKATFDELCGEALVDGKWERRGANETLDLFGYCEAARVQLQPERADIKWDARPPIWARPILLEPADADEPSGDKKLSTKTESPLERMARLNRR